METTSHSASLSDLARLQHRQSVPDAPDAPMDDELMLHFNDPNWDFRANSDTLSISTDVVEIKRWSNTSNHMGATSCASTDSEVDTESQISSWRIYDSKAYISSEEHQVQWVSFYRRLCLIYSPTLFHQGFTVS
jgi:hypothetical protein